MGLVVLADGMGGYKTGEVASEIAVLSVSAELKEAMLSHASCKLDILFGMQTESHLIINAVKNANDAIYYVSKTQPQCASMGTTLVVGLFTNNKLWGCSRLA